MRTVHPFEIAIIVSALTAGIFLFVRVCLLSDAVPTEFRSASPGFNDNKQFVLEKITPIYIRLSRSQTH